MVQAARSGVQNIAEGSLAGGTSKKTELKLTNVDSLGRLDREDKVSGESITSKARGRRSRQTPRSR